MTAFDQLIAVLEGAGLWSDIGADQQRASIQALGSREDVTWAAGGVWRADGENLADGEVEAWLRRMAVPLNDCGLELRVATVSGPFDQGSAGYSVSVNGNVLNLYTFSQDEPGVPETNDPWVDCSIEPAAEVNRLLDTVGSARRVALFWPGSNDGFSVLGEEGVLRRVCEYGRSTGSWECVIP
ncbi:MAG TPA: hypothetical protein VF060_07350 [Trebonia sp.]